MALEGGGYTVVAAAFVADPAGEAFAAVMVEADSAVDTEVIAVVTVAGDMDAVGGMDLA